MNSFNEDFWRKAPKQFLENSAVAFTGEAVYIAMATGGQVVTYALSPGHFKRIQQHLTYQLKQFEEKHGPIQTSEWNPNVVSPIQVPPKDDGDSKKN